MGNSIPIGRFAGFPVAVNWSVLVMLVLFAWSLASATLPAQAPGYGAGVYWIAGLAGALLLIASVLLHELMHAVVARADGIKVLGLTLWIFGGVASFADEPRTARSDFRVAAAGPATSLGLAAVFAGITFAVRAIAPVPILTATGEWLAGVNLVLGVFNLLPGAPLDGGRILRAFLWHRRGDRVKAAIGATRAGLVLAGLLVALGLLGIVRGGVIGGVWSILIGWFLYTAARQEESQVRIRATLDRLRVRDVMNAAPQTAPGWLSVQAFIEQNGAARLQAVYPVIGFDGRVDGIVTRDRLLAVPPGQGSQIRVVDIALPAARTPSAIVDEPLTVVYKRLLQDESDANRTMIVFDGQRFAGLLTVSDIASVAGLRSRHVARR